MPRVPAAVNHEMLLQVPNILFEPIEDMISPGNLARFLRISTPMIVSNFKKSAFSVQPTIAHLFEGITKTSAKGLRFDFSEYD